MAKTKEVLNTIKEKAKNINKKFHELTDEVLSKVLGGVLFLNRGQRKLPDGSNSKLELPGERLPNQAAPSLPVTVPHVPSGPSGIEHAEISKPIDKDPRA